MAEREWREGHLEEETPGFLGECKASRPAPASLGTQVPREPLPFAVPLRAGLGYSEQFLNSLWISVSSSGKGGDGLQFSAPATAARHCHSCP